MRLGKRGKHLLKLCRYSVDIRGLKMYHRLQVELAYLVDFVQFLLWFAPHFTFLHSKLQPHTLWNQFFFKEYIRICFLLFGLVRLTERCSLHIQSTLRNVQYSLLILLFCTSNQSYTPWNLIQSITSSWWDLWTLRKYLKYSLHI